MADKTSQTWWGFVGKEEISGRIWGENAEILFSEGVCCPQDAECCTWDQQEEERAGKEELWESSASKSWEGEMEVLQRLVRGERGKAGRGKMRRRSSQRGRGV